MEKINIPALPGVYLLKNKINGKCYVGESINLRKRYQNHKHNKGNQIINKSINKYKFENFEFIILKTFNITNKTVLWIYENYYIKLYNTLKYNGYNIKPWGRGNLNRNWSQETKNKISKTLKEKEITKGKNNGMYGKKHSKSSLDKMSKNRKKISNDYIKKPIYQIDIQTDKIIKKWNSLTEAKTVLKCNISGISECINNKRKTSFGFKWRYCND